MRVILFGSPRIERAGQPESPRRSKGLALLAYLAVTGVPHRRESLLALLWPEFDEASARNNLRRELSLLRAALGADVLLVDRQHIAWRPSRDHPVDVVAFAEYIATARRHSHPHGLCDDCRHALAAAAELAADDFMAGYSLDDSPAFEEWLLVQREELRQQLDWALEALVGWHEGRGEAQEALALARRWRAIDPLREESRRALMRLYAGLGQQTAALRQYEDLARLLAAELGAAPEPGTTALYEAVRARATPPHDRATLPHDRGTLPHDRATLPHDRGTLPHDRATLPHDRGTPPHDRGTPPHERGTPPHDRAMLPHDRATLPHDRAMLPHDRAMLPHERGTPPHDRATLPHERGTLPHERGTLPHDRATLPHSLVDTAQSWPPVTSFVGRRREILALAARLADPACRLLTLIGPGGIGKTRLAAEVAAASRQRFADGAAFVPLAAATEPVHIPDAIAVALVITLPPGGDPWRSLAAALRDREQLLVLDNLEQLLDAAPLLADLLRAAPRLKLLATSREALRLHEEWRAPVDGLAVPGEHNGAGVEGAPEGRAETAEALQLFVARARQARPDFALDAEAADAARICRLVGGMPLAIELAAAWTASLPCAAIAEEIARGLAILETSMRNTPDRQRSVQAILDQTWARLGEEARGALARLAVFAGAFTREAAAAAGAGPAVLARLLDHALLRRDDDGRYQMHALVHQYAAERLREAPGEAAAARAACATFYQEFLLVQYARQLGGEQRAAIVAVGGERENIRAALPALLDQPPGEPLRRLLQVLDFFYFIRGPYQEGVTALELAEALLRRAGDTPEARLVLAHLLTSLGFFDVRRGAVASAQARFHESVAIFAALGAAPLPGESTDPAIGLGVLALVAGDYGAAGRHAEQVRARAEAHGLIANLAYAWYIRAEAAQAQGLARAAEAAAARALEAARQAGSEWLSAYIHNQLGQLATARDRYAEAGRHLDASFAIREAYGDHEGMALALLSRGALAGRRGRHDEAARHYARSLELYRRAGDRGGIARAMLGQGATAIALGRPEQAREQFQTALSTARELDYHHVALDALTHLAELRLDAGDAEEAYALLSLALRHPASRTDTFERAQRLLLRCESELAPDELAAATELGQRLDIDQAIGLAMGGTLTA